MEIEKASLETVSKVDNYTIIKTLGSGVSAKVKLGYQDDPTKKVAIKVFKEQISDPQLLEKQIHILKAINHPNLVNMIEYNLASKYIKKTDGRTLNVATITMEFISGGELFDYIAQTGRFPEKFCRYYFRQLMDAIDYLHQNGLAHRDLKPDNLMIDEHYNLKVTDFGMTGLLVGCDKSGKMQTYCGTLDYMAPELLMKQEYDGTQVDLFAAAKILFILLTGIPPFPSAALSDKFYALLYNNQFEQFWCVHTKFQQNKNVVFSQEFKELITPMWSFDPTQRLTSEQIRNSDWFKQDPATEEEVKEQFAKRRAIIDAQKEKQRIQKLERKGVPTGGFRSSKIKDYRWENEELQIDDEALEELFQLSKERKAQQFDAKSAQKSDLLTQIEPADILKLLLLARNKLGQEVELDPNHYSVQFQFADAEDPDFPIEYSYQIDVVQDKAEDFLVQFKFLAGDEIEYHVKVQEIRAQLALF